MTNKGTPMATKRRMSVMMALATTTALLAACSGGGGNEASAPDEDVTLTWWHNGTGEPLKGFWDSVAREFEASHPNVTVEVSAVQNEELQKNQIPVALQSADPPDLFQQWGGGELAAQVADGKVKDISRDVLDEVGLIGGSTAGWQVDGATYGLPYSVGVEGFWYNKALFAQAGIEATPTTMTELDEVVSRLKEAGITPIAVGAKDTWPAAHYWYNFAVRQCSTDTMKNAGVDFRFEDPCFTQAGERLAAFLATEPFQQDFLATPAQLGSASSAGLVANGNAAMELMGHWEPGIMESLTGGAGLGADLGWFPFPIVEGGLGDPAAALGGGDGFSCSYSAPPECVELLKYIASVDVQKRYAETGAGLPVTLGSEAGVSDPNMQTLLQYRNSATFVQVWLDVAYGGSIGGAMNDAIGAMFGGQGTPQDIVAAMTAAAGGA
ncbi:extracellular solute-binding protein [Cellulomonas sp. URHB0016]